MYATRRLARTTFLSLLVVGAAACSGDAITGTPITRRASVVGEQIFETFTGGAFTGTWTVNGVAATGANTTTSLLGAGTTGYFGQFGNDSVALSLSGLDAHSSVTIEFDVYVIRSWDGSDTEWGPDIFVNRMDDAGICTTFANNSGQGQHWKDTFTFDGNHTACPAPAVAQEVAGTGRNGAFGTLGYTWYDDQLGDYPEPSDAIYHITYTLPHSLATLTLSFAARGLQALYDESWGIDNVKVTTIF